MSAKSRLARQEKAVSETNRKIDTIQSMNDDGRYDGIIERLKTQLRRQKQAVEVSQTEVELELELGFDI